MKPVFISDDHYMAQHGVSREWMSNNVCDICCVFESSHLKCSDHQCTSPDGLYVLSNVPEGTISATVADTVDSLIEGMEEAHQFLKGEEHDKKKSDITKAKPGQMMEDFNLALLAVSEVTRYGVEKYERPGSWKHAHKDLMKYKDAACRHQLKQPTEMYDDESGYLHLIQVIWNQLALLQMMLEFDKIKPRDLSKITSPIEGLTQEEPAWFKGE